MAVGKGSMERAAKAAGKSTAPVNAAEEKGTASEKKTEAEKKDASEKRTTKSASAGKTVKKAAPAKKTAAEAIAAAETITAPTEEVMQQIVYQKSSGMLERAARPNERFGLGDAMPVYYF